MFSINVIFDVTKIKQVKSGLLKSYIIHLNETP